MNTAMTNLLCSCHFNRHRILAFENAAHERSMSSSRRIRLALMHHRKKTNAFTLVELLVVIAIIGVLVALLLPAVQSAREAARRVSCMNKVKQIGLAIQNHVDALDVFPTGGSTYNPLLSNYVSGGKDNPGTPNGPKRQGLGWAYQILPYLEQGAVKGILTQADIQRTVIPLYFCPSRRAPTVADTPVVGGPVAALCDYASAHPLSLQCGQDYDGVSRYDLNVTHPYTANSHAEAEKAYWCTKPTPDLLPFETFVYVYDGVIVRTSYRVKFAASNTSPAELDQVNFEGPSPTKPANVTDGLSNTLLISEKYVRFDMTDTVAPDGTTSYSDDRGWTDGWDPDTVRFTGYQPISDGDTGICLDESLTGPDNKYCTGASGDVYFFGSSHPSGINAVFADGSVRVISFDVDVLIFNGMGTRNGGELLAND